MPYFDDLYLFLTIVQTGSFTKAGEKLGVSKSALSQSISHLENRLNIRLLNRTTRSVSPTPEGLSLYNDLAPHYFAIGEGLAKLTEHQAHITGTVRINASHLAIQTVILPKLAPILSQNPHIFVQLYSDNRFVDIVAEGFDMGVRLGGTVASGMIAVKISQMVQITLVATPNYLKNKDIPKSIDDLDHHHLINLQLDKNKPPMDWEFWVNGKVVSYTPKSQILMNGNGLNAILQDLGIGLVGLSQVERFIKTGELVEILPEFRMTYEPFYAYYPSRKHHSKAFEVVLNALRE
ncbi:LysR family transcriptional regulator [Moraxella nasicaprae]|uniref:LysR family transcriptional regulator n=1 Tax=Moraxella nasicaprae TaxID=2904122 RepID=A0ABY6F5J5_9GAMM|nr:LysR family transcriptional regulator [Moraxella nasicaprae]UXZ05376.1 LysR family transcriptional regulator [Moraxella nasicaprae]